MKAIVVLLTVAVSNSQAVKITIAQGRNEVSKGSSGRIISFDTDTGNATVLVDKDVNPVLDFVSGATVCHGVYYAVATTFPTFFGVGILKNGSFYATPSDYLFHHLACDDENPGSLLAVASQAAAGKQGAQFSLQRVNPTTREQSIIGNFTRIGFQGYDSIFYIDTANKKAYAGFSYLKPKIVDQSEIEEMDYSGAAGKITSYGAHNKIYSLLKLSDGLYGAVFKVQSESQMYGKFEVEGTKTKFQRTGDGKSLGTLFNGGRPSVICDGMVYTVAPATATALYAIDPKTSKVMKTFDLQKVNPGGVYDFGGLACDL